MSDFSKNRNFGLDFVRASAIIMVLISHARQLLIEPDARLALTFGGWFGVELFFALSGFLIGTILIRLFDNELSPSKLGRFWFRRWMRTLPAYMFILLFFWAVYGRVQFSDFLLLQWPIDHNQGIVPVSWSLAVEEWFYILFPLAALLATATFKKRGIPVAIIAAIVIPVFVRIYQNNSGVDPLGIRVNPFRFDGMAYGVLIAYLVQKTNMTSVLTKYWPVLVAGACLLFAADFLRYTGSMLGLPMPVMPRWYHNVASYIVTGLSAATIVLVFYLRSPRLDKTTNLIVKYISKVSYSLYLWHLFIFSYLLRFFPDGRGFYLYASGIVSAILISFFPYILIEAPFMKLRDYVTTRDKNNNNKRQIAKSEIFKTF